jgi:hypothetical protein
MWGFCTLTGFINDREIKYDIETETIWARQYRKKDKPWAIKSCSYRKDGYLQINIGDKDYLVHRVVYKLYHPKWNIDDISRENRIDHENNNRMDNRIVNLRNVNHQENSFNIKDTKGYSWHKQRNKWRAQIKLNGKNFHLGLFEREEDARNAYLDAKKIYHIYSKVSHD